MSALTKKQLRDAAPIDQLPFEVCRQYGEPKLIGRLSEAKKLILADLDECHEMAKRIGTVEDRDRIQRLRQDVDELSQDSFEKLPSWTFAVVVDETTSTKYVVTIKDRRRR